MRPRRFLGLEFSGFDLPAALDWLQSRAPGAPFAYVVTPNADHLVRLHRDPALAPLYQGAALTLLDSRVVAFGARLLGLAPPPVVTGADLTAALLAVLPAMTPLCLIGLPEAFLPALRARTGLGAIAHHNPPAGFAEDPAAVAAALRFIELHPARFILLAVGSPAQERLAAALAARGRATGTALCIGAAVDFLAGRSRRAPPWMRRAGLEWLHRLALAPRRLGRRYLREDPAILRLLLAARLAR
ncbi:MAG: WecB/TagA/CpsF family glycosyltransferase [Acetobacteraceae bacterium]